MTSELPYWIQLLQALGAPAIAFGAVTIGAMQWYTAHRKTVIDLFERRYKVYREIRAVVSEVVREGTAHNKTLADFDRASEGAEFLFGEDINGSLQVIRSKIARLVYYKTMINEVDLDSEKRAVHIDKQSEALDVFDKYLMSFPKMLRPYVQLDQRNPHLIFVRRFRPDQAAT